MRKLTTEEVKTCLHFKRKWREDLGKKKRFQDTAVSFGGMSDFEIP
jgi:hypothetical protein